MFTASKVNKKSIIIFCILSFLGFCLALLAYLGNSIAYLDFLWSYQFRLLIYLACAVALFILVFQLFTRRLLLQKALKLVYGIIFLPLLLLPIFRCYFKVPYVFCDVCPGQCPWGISRTFIFNAALIFNLSGKFWCVNLCPFGTLQEGQTQISKRNFLLPSWVNLLSYLTLFLFIGMYCLAFIGSAALTSFEIGRYGWVAITASAALLIIIISFLISRFWCRFLCPVGTIAKMTSSFSRFIQKRWKRHS